MECAEELHVPRSAGVEAEQSCGFSEDGFGHRRARSVEELVQVCLFPLSQHLVDLGEFRQEGREYPGFVCHIPLAERFLQELFDGDSSAFVRIERVVQSLFVYFVDQSVSVDLRHQLRKLDLVQAAGLGGVERVEELDDVLNKTELPDCSRSSTLGISPRNSPTASVSSAVLS